MNKKVASEIAVGIILVLVIVLGGIFWMQSKRQEAFSDPQQLVAQNPQAKSVNETMNWQVYRNEKFGFEIKYPDNLKFDSTDYTDPSQAEGSYLKNLASAKEGDSLFSANIYELSTSEGGYGGLNFSIDIDKTNYESINDWFAIFKKNFEKPTVYEGLPIGREIISVQDLNLQGVQARRYFMGGKSPFYDTCISFIKEEFNYNFCYDGTIKEADSKLVIIGVTENEGNQYDEKKMEEFVIQYRKLLDDMVSTFKFTK